MSLHVLIPARDEGPRVGATVHAVQRVLPGARVLVVDGGSRDDTALRARQAGAEVIAQGGTGYAGALLTGYRHLHRQGATRVVQLDADGQHPADAAPVLLDALGPGRHLVTASRQGTRSGGALGRRLGNQALSELVRWTTGVRLHDVTSGFWAFDDHALRLLVAHLSGDCADANVRVLAIRLGIRPVELPVAMTGRSAGRSMHDGWRGLVNFGLSVRRVLDARRAAITSSQDGAPVVG